MGLVLDMNFQSGGGDYLKFMFQSTNSNFYKTRSERRRSHKRWLVGGAPSGVCWGAEPPKMVVLVMCPLKTNAGVY